MIDQIEQIAKSIKNNMRNDSGQRELFSPDPRHAPVSREDSMQNLMTGLGTDRDKRMYSTFQPAVKVVQEIDVLVEYDDMAHNIVFIPAEEMTREWIDLQGDNAELVEKELQRIGAQQAFYEAIAWERAYGGALIVVGIKEDATDVNDDVDYSMPFMPGIGKEIEWLAVYDSAEVMRVEYDQKGDPEIYEVSVAASIHRGETIRRIHASRVLRFQGEPKPRRERMKDIGEFGQSVLMRCRDRIRDVNVGHEGIATALNEFDVTVLKMKELTKMLAADKSGVARKRIQQMDTMKSLFRMVTLDSEDDIASIGKNLSGVPETIDRLVERVASAARMPVSLLMGRSPAGLNATGDSDIRWFYDHIRAQQNQKIKPPLMRLVEIICASKGIQSIDYPTIEFAPLWTMSDKEKAELHSAQAQADTAYISAGVLDPEEVAISRFGATGYSTETVIDVENRQELPIEPDEKETGNGLGAEELIDDQTGEVVSPNQRAALNGIQISSMREIVMSVARGELPRDSGIAILAIGFMLKQEEAEQIMGSAGSNFKLAEPPTE